MPLQAGRYPPSSTGTPMSSTGSAQMYKGCCELSLQQDPPQLQPPRLSRGGPTPFGRLVLSESEALHGASAGSLSS